MDQAKPDILNPSKALTIVSFLVLWFVVLIVPLAKFQLTTHITPAVLLHGSALGWLLLSVTAFKGSWPNDLAIKSFKPVYFFVAVFIAFVFWQIQQITLAISAEVSWESGARQWQQAQQGFAMWSVFLASCVLAPVLEEMFFRGLVFTQLKARMPVLFAAMLSSALFTLLHWDANQAVWLFSAGVFYAYFREKSGSVWPAVLAHITHNVMTFWLYASL